MGSYLEIGIRRGPRGLFPSWEDTMKASSRRPCSTAPSQPCLLFISPSLGSGCELLSLPHATMPLLGSTTTKCFNTMSLAMRPSPPSVLALLWDAYQRMAFILPSSCANMQGP